MTDRTATPPPIAVTLAGALALYMLFSPIVMDGVGNDPIMWLRHSADPGLLPGAALIKIAALAGIVVLAIAIFQLLRTLGVAHAARWAALIMLMPTTMLNAALRGQCDAIWAAPCIAALDAAIGRRHRAMLLWCGIALAIKVQAILFAPFVIALLLQRRVPIRLWFIAPAAFMALAIPAWFMGRPDLATLYLRQAGGFPLLSIDAPNVWFVVETLFPSDALKLSGLATAAAIGACAFYIARFSVQMPSGHRALPVALLALLITAGLLPYMQARYFFLADIVAFVWAATSGNRRAWLVAILVQAGSTLAIAASVLGSPELVIPGFVAMTTATCLVARPLLQPAANDNPLMVRAI